MCWRVLAFVTYAVIARPVQEVKATLTGNGNFISLSRRRDSLKSFIRQALQLQLSSSRTIGQGANGIIWYIPALNYRDSMFEVYATGSPGVVTPVTQTRHLYRMKLGRV